MAAYDRYYYYVVMLLRGNGDDGSQTITDERSHTVTVNGNTCIKTATKKFGSGSIYFDGTGDYLTISPADYLFGTDDFTVEAWIYKTTSGAGNIVSNWNDSASGRWALRIDSSNHLNFHGTISVVSTIVVPSNEWVHVAASKSGSTIRLYINGVKWGEQSFTTSLGVDTSTLGIGHANSVTPLYFSGYQDDVRITKYARYTEDTFRLPTSEASTTNAQPDITLTSITPNKGPTSGGTLVTLAGTGFTDYTECTIDGNSLTTIITVSDTELTGYTPPGTLGLKDVIVTNP